MILTNQNAQPPDLEAASALSDVETHAQCSVTIPPASIDGYFLVSQIFAGYAGGGTGTLTITGTVNGTTVTSTYTITGMKGESQISDPAYDASSSVSITLSDGGVGITGVLVAEYTPK